MRRAIAFISVLAAPALAHGGAHEVEEGAPGWTLDPWVVGPLLILALLYAVGAWRLRGRASGGRRGLARQRLLFAGGWLVLAGSLVSPLHEGGERSFTLHMIEHELIILVAALLLVLSRPGPTLLWALPKGLRLALGRAGQWGWLTRFWRFLTDPIVATMLQTAALCIWHVPALFDRALGHTSWHIAQHASFLVSALLFWWAMVHGRAGRNSYGISAMCLFATVLVGGMLGALMSFSGSPWYQGYAAMEMMPLGLTPVEDQQLAGLIMWIPGGIVHAGAALIFLYKWLKASEERHAVAAG